MPEFLEHLESRWLGGLVGEVSLGADANLLRSALLSWRTNPRVPWWPRLTERLGDFPDPRLPSLPSSNQTWEQQLRDFWDISSSANWGDSILARGFLDNTELARSLRRLQA